MRHTISTQTNPLTIVEEPTTETQEAIVEEILNDPEATNGDVADAVQERLGGGEDDRPSASWVSRIRSTKVAERDVDDVPDDVAEANERLRTVEALVVGEYTDDLVADVLRRRADDLDDRS